ncbi:hypothetical protein C8J56DRAFT_768966, partial [Mycena floridula]
MLASANVLARTRSLRKSVPTALAVGEHQSDWSDHAPVAIRLAIPAISLEKPYGSDHKRKRWTPPPLPANTDLDRLLMQTIHSKAAKDSSELDTIGKYYGQCQSQQKIAPTAIYVEAHCDRLMSGEIISSFGIFLGVNNRYNLGARLHGLNASINRAHLAGILAALENFPSRDTPVIVFSPSFYALDTITWNIDAAKSSGWTVTNGDLIRKISEHLLSRPGPVHFQHLK